jgi:hypothetical protein
MKDDMLMEPPPRPGNPPPDPGPIQCAHEPDEQGKCKKCGRWGQFFQGVGEAIGEWKFGE